MATKPIGWLHYLAGFLGGILLGYGVAHLSEGFSLWYGFLSLVGLIVLGWAIVDYRRFRHGTPESEVDGPIVE